MMATNISGTMMTSAWAPLNVASAVDAEEVVVATVATSARPITMTSSASSRPLVAFIFSTDEIKELAGKYLVNHTRTCKYYPVGAPQDEVDKQGGLAHGVRGQVQHVVDREGEVSDGPVVERVGRIFREAVEPHEEAGAVRLRDDNGQLYQLQDDQEGDQDRPDKRRK